MKISWKFFVQKMIFKTFDGARLVHHTEPSITEPSISEMMKIYNKWLIYLKYLNKFTLTLNTLAYCIH